MSADRGRPGGNKVVLLQAELGHPDQAIHVAGGLFKRDLERAGFEVEAWLVPAAAAARLAASIPDASLYLLDSVFPLRHARAVQRAVADRAVVCVGGPNAVQHLLRGTVPLVVDGAGRRAVTELARRVRESVDAGDGPMPTAERLADVPNLLHAVDWDPEAAEVMNSRAGPRKLPRYAASVERVEERPEVELFPFEPDLDWRHPDPGRDPEARHNAPSLVAAWGCVYNPPIRDYEAPPLPGHLTPSAAEHLRLRYLERAAGCSFCSFRYQEHRVLPRARALDLLTEQLRYYRDRVRPAALSLQTEDPFDLLERVVEWLGREWGGPVELRVRSLVKVILAREAVLRRCVDSAARAGVRIRLQQVGFESFSDPTLELFHKGVDAAANRRCARLLSELSAHPSGAFEGRRGHGLILLHPWTRLADLRADLDAVRADAPWLMERLGPEQRLELYADLHPIAVRALRAGLVERDEERADFGLAWRFAHEETADLVETWSEIDGTLNAGLERVRLRTAGRAGWAARLRGLRAARRVELLEGLLEAAEQGGLPGAAARVRARVLRDLPDS